MGAQFSLSSLFSLTRNVHYRHRVLSPLEAHNDVFYDLQKRLTKGADVSTRKIAQRSSTRTPFEQRRSRIYHSGGSRGESVPLLLPVPSDVSVSRGETRAATLFMYLCLPLHSPQLLALFSCPHVPVPTSLTITISLDHFPGRRGRSSGCH